jgi:NAD(P)-dependent dehydrogenase (short-subunit alcohol dehydrogenase family)
MTRLNGKRALITGGTSGIGLETAKQFVAEGARVIVTGTNPATIAAAQEELGPDVIVVRGDAGNVDDQKRLAAQVAETFGQLDVLFVNAGVVGLRPVDQWTEADFDRSFAVNLKGPYFLIQALLPVFAKPASIVFNGSINARIGMPNSSVYAATKAGLISLARTMSGELISRGIRVNVVSPGPVATPIYGKLGMEKEQLDSVAESIRSQIPVGRFGEPVEIAKAIVFLASDESSFTVGSELVIDGGMSNL